MALPLCYCYEVPWVRRRQFTNAQCENCTCLHLAAQFLISNEIEGKYFPSSFASIQKLQRRKGKEGSCRLLFIMRRCHFQDGFLKGSHTFSEKMSELTKDVEPFHIGLLYEMVGPDEHSNPKQNKQAKTKFHHRKMSTTSPTILLMLLL